ncbi:MAG: tetratricopeptide repeat protein, partial [Spirulinaceae cyanobacterium]
MKLNLRFPSPQQVSVEFEQETETLEFVSPLKPEDHEEIGWYLETYATQYTTEVDDERAKRIEEKLSQWGEDLFTSVFNNRAAQRIFNAFQEEEEVGRLITISAQNPEILALPWELLRDPQGTYLCHENPRISIRRRFAKAGGGRKPFKVKAKKKLRLLYIISRPNDCNFIDPRGESQGVLEAIAQAAPGIVEVEFLRPPTLSQLVERLENRHLPTIDLIHFDGHGVFDADGSFAAKSNNPDAATKKAKGNMGYLLFEKSSGEGDLISAEKLGNMLHRQKISAIILSACQSAQMGNEPMGSVAARLTHAGIPTVLAMTYSVLVRTAKQLFQEFYRQLLQGEGMGEALDNARRNLYINSERGERQRGQARITLQVQDWFLPALYQSGNDTPLLPPGEVITEEKKTIPNNLPEVQEAGFWGRSRELWEIETAFVRGTRRITVHGFGGQGKTYLVQEVGRWLQRTVMFSHVCFVDYAAFQGIDAVGLAVSSLGVVLEKSFVDAEAVENYLKSPDQKLSLLLILDNLETLTPEASQELLTVAKKWSEIGNNRLLITTRQGNLNHPDYPTSGSRKHISLALKGLGREDALSYFQELMKLPPKPLFPPPPRRKLLRLFGIVDFHPLSIGLLANQLKVQRVGEVKGSLEKLIEEAIAATANSEDKNVSLLASLRLSLQMLPEEVQGLLPKLGVFHGGVWEPMITDVMKLFTEEQWQQLRPALENAGLIQPEILPGWNAPYLKFHPTLTPALRQEGSANITSLQESYCQAYYQLSLYLYTEDDKNPHQVRAIAKRELPNLLNAVKQALDTQVDYAVDFVDKVNYFLDYFGLNRERVELTERVQKLSQDVGSQSWYLAQINLGEQLYNGGRYQEAAQVFAAILQGLGDTPSYNLCITLNRLGRCLESQGQAAQSAARYRQALAVAAELEVTPDVQRQIGNLYADLADVLRDMGQFEEAKENYEKSLAIKKKIGGDKRGEAVVQGQLGTLALVQGNLADAEKSYKVALQDFQQLGEPKQEAIVWHQLGMVYQEAKVWGQAESAYRQSAQIKESQGNLAGAATSWNQLAVVCEYTGKLEEAEAWYRKGIEGFKVTGDKINQSKALNNLANLLQNQPQRLPEAQQLVEEALAINKTLDPGAAQIWKTYNILA